MSLKTDNNPDEILLLPFGGVESNNKIVSELDKEFFVKLFNDKTDHLIINFMKYIYFNESKPHNYVIYMDRSSNYLFEKNNEWISHEPQKIIDSSFTNTTELLKLILVADEKNKILDQCMVNEFNDIIFQYDWQHAPDIFELSVRLENVKELSKPLRLRITDFSIASKNTYLLYRDKIPMVPLEKYKSVQSQNAYLRKKIIALEKENISLKENIKKIVQEN